MVNEKEGMVDLNAKCAVITGGAMGIGFATAKRFVAGDCLVNLGVLNGPALEEAKSTVQKMGGRSSPISAT